MGTTGVQRKQEHDGGAALGQACAMLAVLRLAFARAVADPDRCWVYGPANKENVQPVPLERAVGASLAALIGGVARTYFVRPAAAVLALDADDRAQADVLERVAADLTARGYRPVLLASGRKDGQHLWCRLPDAPTREAWEKHAVALAGGARAIVRRNGLRPPFAPHRLGYRVRLLNHATPGDALDALTTPPTHIALPPASAPVSTPTRVEAPVVSTVVPIVRRPLPASVLHRLQTGDVSGLHDDSPSAVLQSALVGMVRAGWTATEAFAACAAPANRGGLALQRRLGTDEVEAQAWFDRSWRKAEAFAARTTPTPPRAHADTLKALEPLLALATAEAAQGTWCGQGGASRLAVLRALICIAVEAGTMTPHASVRRLAERTGFGVATVSRALDWLRKAGWCRRGTPDDTGGEAQVHDLTPPCSSGTLKTHPRPQCTPLSVPPVHAAVEHADVFRRVANGAMARGRRVRGLGPTKGAVVAALLAQQAPMPTRVVAAALGMSRGNCRRHLVGLARVGLAGEGPDGWAVVPDAFEPARLRAVAVALGTEGSTERQKAHHSAERVALVVIRGECARLATAVLAAAEAQGWPAVELRLPRRLEVKTRRIAGESVWRRFVLKASSARRWLNAALAALRPDVPIRVRLEPVERPRRMAARVVKRAGDAGKAGHAGNAGPSAAMGGS